jgi:hypothetical protein
VDTELILAIIRSSGMTLMTVIQRCSGIYLYRMESSNFTATNKMMLMK